jgi:hypothetical protein
MPAGIDRRVDGSVGGNGRRRTGARLSRGTTGPGAAQRSTEASTAGAGPYFMLMNRFRSSGVTFGAVALNDSVYLL